MAALAGCSSSGSLVGERRESAATPITVLAAGSLRHALETGLQSAVDVPVRIEAHGSTTAARMVETGQRDPDVLAVADTALFEDPVSPPWYSVFASNAVVLAYNPDTEGGRRIADAGPRRWYRPLLDGAVSLGRTDPDQDPLGYRTLFTFELATRYYDDAQDLRERIPSREQIYPETGLLSQFETGAIDAAVAYRNMAVERGYEFFDLPDRIDLSNPDYTGDWYSTVSYELANGRTVRGGLVGYGATIRKPSDGARSVFAALTTGAYLDASGFVRREQFPRYVGDVPDAVRQTVTGATGRSSAERTDGRTPGDPTGNSPAGGGR